MIEKGKAFLSHNGIHLEDYGCGSGIKTGLIAAALQKHDYPVNSCTLIDSERITTDQAEKQVKQLVKKPGLFRRQKPITFYHTLGNFIDLDPSLNRPIPKDGEQRIRLCLGNTVGNYKPEVVYSALASGLNTNDLLVIGLLRQDFDLPVELANQTIRDDSPELNRYPEAFRVAMEIRAANSKKATYFKDDILGLDKEHYDFHVSYNPARGWIHELVIKGVDEESSPDLYSKGLRNGHIIQLSNARVQTTAEHIQDLKKYFTVVGEPLEDKNIANTLFILKNATSNL